MYQQNAGNDVYMLQQMLESTIRQTLNVRKANDKQKIF